MALKPPTRVPTSSFDWLSTRLEKSLPAVMASTERVRSANGRVRACCMRRASHRAKARAVPDSAKMPARDLNRTWPKSFDDWTSVTWPRSCDPTWIGAVTRMVRLKARAPMSTWCTSARKVTSLCNRAPAPISASMRPPGRSMRA